MSVNAKGRLIKRTSATPSADGTVLEVSQEEAGWQYVSFKVWRLHQGQSIEDGTRNEEVGLVVLSGKVTVETPSATWDDIGKRSSVFEGKPYVVYLPPGMPFVISAVSDCEIARCGSRAEKGASPRLVTPEEISEEIRGEGNAQRVIRHLYEADRPAQHIFLVEAITPSGNWSSYPPHKHDRNDPPNETYLEETYYHRFRPEQGFGYQRVYTDDRDLDEVLLIQDGDLVMVPRGYHPVVTAPGYDLYYLNVMAGPIRQWRFKDDPAHAWVASSWKPYGG